MISNARSRETPLKRMRKLASSGWPLELFVMAAFDIMDDDVVPGSPLKGFWFDSSPPEAYIVNSPSLYRDLALATLSRPIRSTSGLRMHFYPGAPKDVWSVRTVWPTESWALSSFPQTDASNLVIRAHGWKDAAISVWREGDDVFGTILPGGAPMREHSRRKTSDFWRPQHLFWRAD